MSGHVYGCATGAHLARATTAPAPRWWLCTRCPAAKPFGGAPWEAGHG